MIHKYVKLFGEQIKYDGKILKQNMIIQLINNKGKNNFVSIAKVNVCKKMTNSSTKECIIELLLKKEKDKEKRNQRPFSETKIVLRIYELNGKCSLYILYFFENIYNYVVVEHFTKIKNKELLKFKNMVENYNNNIISFQNKENSIK